MLCSSNNVFEFKTSEPYSSDNVTFALKGPEDYYCPAGRLELDRSEAVTGPSRLLAQVADAPDYSRVPQPLGNRWLAAAREWLNQNFQGSKDGQSLGTVPRTSGHRKSGTMMGRRVVPSPLQARMSQLEVIQLATTLRDPRRRPSTESSLAGDSGSETEGSTALFVLVTPQTANDL
ncbi:hypothetical protein NDU88_007001 [Pleurodeles waltl]|uniref:Uncharacterized protein n=1 Tax=Pleurodeles waltl TaxID=8319 RepID=A0AAV7SR94_PLEWA|nr:hypothetical protein NDU88_007001 [Pleurodeles waltl]